MNHKAMLHSLERDMDKERQKYLADVTKRQKEIEEREKKKVEEATARDIKLRQG